MIIKDSESKTQVLVVEDEILLAKDIVMRLEDLNYKVVGVASNAEDALVFLRKKIRVDIALLDIMIQGSKDGIELAKIIKNEFRIPFIFLSSHSDATVIERVKHAGAHAYILKPFNDRQVSIAIELALVNFSKNMTEVNLLEKKEFAREENQFLKINNSLFLKKGNYFENVPINEVLYLKAEGNYSTIYTKKGKFVYSVLLKAIAEKFPVDSFIRVHRSYVVNINAIEGFEGNCLSISKNKIPVSKSYRDIVFNMFLKI